MKREPRGIARRVARLTPKQRDRLLATLPPGDATLLDRYWPLWAQAGQETPPGDWHIWLIRAGRGFGKTRAGAEWVSEVARRDPTARIALVGGTLSDVRRVMVEGESGILAVARDDEAPVWRATTGELRFSSGAIAHAFSAAAPEKLRGAQHHAAWCDELAKWRKGDSAWDNLMFGLRLGAHPRVVVTTTPRAAPLLRRVMAARGLVETRGRTHDNVHVATMFAEAMEAAYGGTALGRQELDGEMIEDIDGALWTRAMIEACRVAAAPPLSRVVVAVDPPAGTVAGDGDACGIVAVGVDAAGLAYVLEDASVAGASPDGWARAVAACAARHGADRVVAEKNQGGEMVRHVLMGADEALPLTLVHASRGKAARAEPMVLLYERGRVRHVGAFPALEDEMCGLMTGGGYAGPGRSPDRADALVWALTALTSGRRGQARVRRL